MTPKLINYHVADPKNIGDLMSSPFNYFDFPGFNCQVIDLRNAEDTLDAHTSGSVNTSIVLGGGGLLFERFLPNIQSLISKADINWRILWGAGQQRYGSKQSSGFQDFDYGVYTNNFDLVGIRDFNCGQTWVPCASCMHPAFNKVRVPSHKYVVFSHKKFQISFNEFPRMTNAHADMEDILDFLGSGEVILTSSFHGAYWGTLLGRKVLAFPFSSKFFTLKHLPELHSINRWSSTRFKLSILNRPIYELKYKNKFTCSVKGWQNAIQNLRTYPNSLEECRDRTQTFYQNVMDLLTSS